MLLTLSITTYADDENQIYSPYQEIKITGNKLFGRIAASQQELHKFPELMREIVEQELLPSIDYKYASYKILGKHLTSINTEQREKFVQSMRSYLIRTYATALNQYKNQQVIYESGNVESSTKMTSVNAKIVDLNKPDVHLTFQMRKQKKTGQWKAYDLIVEGISLLNTKQAELKGRISKYGIDQVTIELTSIAQ